MHRKGPPGMSPYLRLGPLSHSSFHRWFPGTYTNFPALPQNFLNHELPFRVFQRIPWFSSLCLRTSVVHKKLLTLNPTIL